MNKALLAPCGLYCGVCGIFIATRDNNEELKEKLANGYGVKAEQIACKGCLSNERFAYCLHCNIRNCIMKKKYEGCHVCKRFPCKLIDKFPFPLGKHVILRSVHSRGELGTEKWVEEEEKRYKCPHCDGPLFRGTKRCGRCKGLVNID